MPLPESRAQLPAARHIGIAGVNRRGRGPVRQFLVRT